MYSPWFTANNLLCECFLCFLLLAAGICSLLARGAFVLVVTDIGQSKMDLWGIPKNDEQQWLSAVRSLCFQNQKHPHFWRWNHVFLRILMRNLEGFYALFFALLSLATEIV